jgi:ribosomal protein L11 methyltransferase
MKMEPNDSVQWAELLFRPGPEFSGENAEIIAEDLGAILIERGASGATVEPDCRVRCFYRPVHSKVLPNRLADKQADTPALSELGELSGQPLSTGIHESTLLECAESFGFILCKRSLVGDRNWVQECADVWQPLLIGALTLNPILSLEAAPKTPRPPRELRLIPGFGFGTGHHPTTAMILEALQNDASERARDQRGWPKSALDVGTGSGILALGICECFDVHVDAIDNDPLALSNARDNLALNGREKSISLSVGELASIAGTYDLIVANLYAEVLEMLCEDLAAKLSPGGILILSGIAAHLLERVLLHYQNKAPTLKVKRTEIRDDWSMIILQSPGTPN